MIKHKTRGMLRQLLRDRSGNTIAMVAALTAPLLALVGGGIDMGRSYLAESRLQAACDAGVLAARKKLGSSAVVDGIIPADVSTVGYKYFNLNFRNSTYGTNNRNFVLTLQPDYSISGVATVDVPTTIMKLFAINKVALQAKCESQLNFNNTDVMMVLDTTGSMAQTNPSDTQPRITVLKNVVKNFFLQLDSAKAPSTRIRYGFVPYSTNVNVGALLQNNWVVTNWTYQSRFVDHIADEPSTNSWNENWVTESGSYAETTYSSYAATYHPATNESNSAWYSCDGSEPSDTYTNTNTLLSTTTTAYAGPPAGNKVTEHRRLWENGSYYWTNRSGTTCTIIKATFTNLTRTYDRVTVPYVYHTTYYQYAPVARDVSLWRTETSGCIEERGTYEINDYNNVDFAQALDLDLDTVPTAGVPATQWRPQYKDIIWERNLDWYGNGSFKLTPTVTYDGWFFKATNNASMVACPAPSRKLAEMTGAQLDTYLATLTPAGNTYHDIGMIWGGRLLSPTGLFAAENADVPGKPTGRHLIFLTDGQTEAYDIAYSAYGVEPLDQRRWKPTSPLSLNQTVEKRFGVACDQVKNRNVTVWVIGFGTAMTNLMKSCAGNGHWFQANDAIQLQAAFTKIVASIGDLRVTK